MDIDIEYIDDSVRVKYSKSTLPIEEYAMSNEVNFTNLVITLSNLNEDIVIKPKSYKEFKNNNPDLSKEIIKVVDYLYQILNSYKESYNEFFVVDND